MKNKRIIITVTSDLCTDQRVQKVALSLQNIGFDVLLIGRKRRRSRSFTASFPFQRMKLVFEKGFFFYAEYNIRLFFRLLRLKADIQIACDTDTLIPNYLVSKIVKRKLLFDAHEIFPEVPELYNRKNVKRCWLLIEQLIFPRLQYAMTVCDSIARYYKEKYGINMKVIRNIAYLNNDLVKPLILAKDKKILLYQGALNEGRGLEWLIDCMHLLDDCVLIVIGGGPLRWDLKRRVSKQKIKDKVEFIGRILPEELVRYTKAADIGLCLLENKGLSYYYSLPNRVFDYMQAGIPILASNFPEIATIVKEHNTGVLIDHYEPEYLASVITTMLKNGKEEYSKNLKEISKLLCWEKEQEKLFELVADMVEHKYKHKK